MNHAPSLLEIFLVVAAVWCLPVIAVCVWVVADRIADRWEDRRDERLEILRPAPVEYVITEPTIVRSLTDAPAVDRISEIIAANEAARADWTEPNRWGA